MPDILVITDTPVGKAPLASKVVSSVMTGLGAQYTLASVFPTMSPAELKKKKPADWLVERDRLLVEAASHDRVLMAGGFAAAAVMGSPKTVAITKVRGRMYQIPDTEQWAMPTFSPGTVVKDSDFFRDFVFDAEKVITRERALELPDIDIQLIESKKDLALLKDLHSYDFVSCDIETTGFGVTAELLSIGFGVVKDDGTGYVIVIPFQLIGREVYKFLTTYEGHLVFHNLKFDIQHLKRAFGHFWIKNPADTMMMNYMLDERPFNRYRSHSLKLLARTHFDAPDYDVDMGDWLEEYFREPADPQEQQKWREDFILTHSVKAKTYWREANPDLPWRGLKIGRDIDPEEVYPLIPLPKSLLDAPSKERRAEMWEELLTYQGLDVYYTARLFPLLRERMDEESPRLWHLCQNVYVPASVAFSDMEMNGAPINVGYFHEMQASLTKELAGELEVLQSIVYEMTSLEEFNPNSSHQVKKILYGASEPDDKGVVGLGLDAPKDAGRNAYKRAAGSLSTDKDVLKVLARTVAKESPATSELIHRILKFRIRSKILGTYINGILARCDEDGHVRGDFNLHGTATGRTSCSNPNLQNIPDASHVGYDIRKGFTAGTEEWTLLEADYSQLELRVAALFSQDDVLLRVYREGGDIHQEVAYMLWNKPKDDVTKYERYLAKCMNFGVIYGRGGRSIATGPEMDNLKEMSGKSWSVKQIEDYFNKFKQGYKQLFDWMELVKKDSLKKQYVENPLGFRRRFDCIFDSDKGHVERQTVNSPIQGFAGQLMILAIVEMNKRFDRSRAQILFTVHDSVVVRAHHSYRDEAAHIIKDVMENSLPDIICSLPQLKGSPNKVGEPLEYNLPFLADVKTGSNWGDCYDDVENWEPDWDPDATGEVEDLAYA